MESDQPAEERKWSHLSSSRASRAVQIWMRRAFSVVPTKVLTLRFCLRALKKIDLPALAVDLGQGGGPEPEVVGEDLDLPLLVSVPDDDAPQPIGAVGAGPRAGQRDDVVGEDGLPLGRSRDCSIR